MPHFGTVLLHILICKTMDLAWYYLKIFVQALVLYWLAVRFAAFFGTSYYSTARVTARN